MSKHFKIKLAKKNSSCNILLINNGLTERLRLKFRI
jgi:hypothetical protein